MSNNFTGVNFINVLRARFSYKILALKITKPKVTRASCSKAFSEGLSYEKRACKMLMKLTQGETLCTSFFLLPNTRLILVTTSI